MTERVIWWTALRFREFRTDPSESGSDAPGTDFEYRRIGRRATECTPTERSTRDGFVSHTRDSPVGESLLREDGHLDSRTAESTFAAVGDAIVTRRLSAADNARLDELVAHVREADASFVDPETLLHDFGEHPPADSVGPYYMHRRGLPTN